MAYNYKASLTIDNTKVSGASNHSNFPVLVSGTYDGTASEPDIRTTGNGGNVENTDGGLPADLAFFSDSGLSTAIDFFIQDYNASTGEIIAWVEVPTLDVDADTVIYMGYGDSGDTTTGSNHSNTFSTECKTHVPMDGADTSTTFTDETGNHSWSAGGNAQIDTAQSQIGGASGLFDGTGDYIDTPDSADWNPGSGDFTISFWIRRNSTGLQYLLGQSNSVGGIDTQSWWARFNSSNQIDFSFVDSGSPSNSIATSTGTITNDSSWHYVTLTRDGNTLRIYIDKSADGTQDITGLTANDSANKLAIGRLGEYTSSTFNGWFDEFRYYKGTHLSLDWHSTEYNSQSSPTDFFSMGVETEVGVTPPFFSNYNYRKKITIDSLKVEGTSDLTNFPVLISETDADLATTGNGGKVENTDGSGGADGSTTVPADFTFTDVDNTGLDFEIESYNSSTGEIVAWVEIPTLTHDSDYEVRMYYGDSNVTTSQENVSGTWNANYAGVWNFSTHSNDSTNNNDGTDTSVSYSDSYGQIDGGATFNNSSSGIALGAKVIPSSGAFSVGGWFKTGASGSYRMLVNENDGDSGKTGIELAVYGSNNKLTFRFTYGAGGGADAFLISSDSAVNDDTFHSFLVTWTGDTSSNGVKLYVDGNLNSQATASQNISAGSDNTTIGIISQEDQWYFDGELDHIHITSNVIDSDWAITEYNSQSSPSTFYTMGSEEVATVRRVFVIS